MNRLTDADLPWAPGEGMRTIAGQLIEIANKEREVLIWLRKGVWPDGDPDSFDPDTATLEEIKAVFKSLRTDTYSYIDSLSEAELGKPHQSPKGWWEALLLEQCPRSEILRNIAVHEWYHTGQLITYLWLRGDDPDKW